MARIYVTTPCIKQASWSDGWQDQSFFKIRGNGPRGIELTRESRRRNRFNQSPKSRNFRVNFRAKKRKCVVTRRQYHRTRRLDQVIPLKWCSLDNSSQKKDIFCLRFSRVYGTGYVKNAGLSSHRKMAWNISVNKSYDLSINIRNGKKVHQKRSFFFQTFTFYPQVVHFISFHFISFISFISRAKHGWNILK